MKFFCFALSTNRNRFCVGDRFYLCDNKILCESDYEDRVLLQNGLTNLQQDQSINHNNNNIQESVNHNLKSMSTANGKSSKRYNCMGRNHNGTNGMPTTYNTSDFINYDVRRPVTDMSIGVR